MTITTKATPCGKWGLEVRFISRNRSTKWEPIDYFSDYYAAYEAMDKAFRNTQGGLFLAVYRVIRVY